MFESEGKIMRHVKFYPLENVDYARVVKLLRLVAKKVRVAKQGFQRFWVWLGWIKIYLTVLL